MCQVRSRHFEFSTVSYVAIFMFEIPKFVLKQCYEVVTSIHESCFCIHSIYEPLSSFLTLIPKFILCPSAQQNMSLISYICNRILSTGDSNILISAEVCFNKPVHMTIAIYGIIMNDY